MAYRNLHGKRVILTGVSSGIGLEMARLLAKRGAKLVLNARRAERVQALEQELQSVNCQVATVIGDVTSAEVRQQLLATAQTKFGGLDILINNAGLGGIGNFADNDEARLRQIFEVNFFAPLELIRAAIPLLKQGTQPLIANVASVLGHVSVPKKSEYCASKFALHGFSDSLRGELEPDGIQVLLISPSTTQSEFFDSALGDRRLLKWANAGQASSRVAQIAVAALESKKHEIIMTPGGCLLVWLDRLFPRLTHWLVVRNS